MAVCHSRGLESFRARASAPRYRAEDHRVFFSKSSKSSKAHRAWPSREHTRMMTIKRTHPKHQRHIEHRSRADALRSPSLSRARAPEKRRKKTDRGNQPRKESVDCFSGEIIPQITGYEPGRGVFPKKRRNTRKILPLPTTHVRWKCPSSTLTPRTTAHHYHAYLRQRPQRFARRPRLARPERRSAVRRGRGGTSLSQTS